MHSKHSYKSTGGAICVFKFVPRGPLTCATSSKPYLALFCYDAATLTMDLLTQPFPLPLSTQGPPAGFDWEENDMSPMPSFSSFATGIDARDRFHGRRRCVVCGAFEILQHCHVIRRSEPRTVSQPRSNTYLYLNLPVC